MRQVVVCNAIDSTSGALTAIAHSHQEIHEGSLFHVGDLLSVSTTTQKWLITTPNSAALAHMVVGIECTGEVELVITEGADRTGATQLTPVNHNRTSATAATVVVHRGISGGTTDGAVAIFSVRSGSTGLGSKTIQAGGRRGENEYILKPNTKYVVSAETFAAVHVTLELDWYEHGA